MHGVVSRNGPITGCCLLTASARKLPELEAILASHALIHAAEGEFYRDAVATAAARIAVPVHRVRERELELTADSILRSGPDRKAKLERFGREVGPP